MTLLRAAFCRVLEPAGDTPPEWIPLLPSGPVVAGVDGRSWTMPDPEAVIRRTLERAERRLPVPALILDWEHGSEKLAPQGHRAPAAGWIDALEVRDDGEIWGRVEWTPDGARDVVSRAYRYVSPAFDFSASDRAIQYLTSVGLTNEPNLNLPALNRAGQEEYVMEPKILKALGLPESAGADDVVRAINAKDAQLEAARNTVPSLDKFVPREDFDRALNRATAAEKALAEREKAELDRAIETEIEAASKAGKITPATVEYHRAQCRTEGGLERFRQFVASAPVIAPDSSATAKPPAGGNGAGLDDTERAVCRAMGLTEDEYLKARSA